jgi:hypothetical protein
MRCFRRARSADRRGRSARNCPRVAGDGAVRPENKRADVEHLDVLAELAVTVIAKKATITSTATVSTSANDPNLANNTASITTNVK